MAKLWWTTDPSKYYSKQIQKGGRNAVIFTVLGCVYFHTWYSCKVKQAASERTVINDLSWERSQYNGQNVVIDGNSAFKFQQ